MVCGCGIRSYHVGCHQILSAIYKAFLMKILIFVSQFYQVSGAEKLALDLAQHLSARGVEVHVLSMYTKNLPGVSEATRLLEKSGITVSFLNLPIGAGFLSLFKGVVRLRKLLRVYGYDAVEASSIGPMIIVSIATLRLTITSIFGIHAVMERRMHDTVKHRIWRALIKWRKSIKIYAISEAVSKAWCHYARISEKRVRIIYNAIPDEFFNEHMTSVSVRDELSIPYQSRIVLFVGSIMKYKGIDILIDAVGPVLEAQDSYLVFVGEGNKAESFYPAEAGFYDSFYQRIRDSSWSNRVKFLGNRNDVARLMAGSNVLAHPARTEGFGLVLVEALAVGLPIVATDVGGIPEVLNGTLSIVVPAEDVERFRQGVLTMLNAEPVMLENIQEIGKRRANDFRLGVRSNEFVGMVQYTDGSV